MDYMIIIPAVLGPIILIFVGCVIFHCVTGKRKLERQAMASSTVVVIGSIAVMEIFAASKCF